METCDGKDRNDLLCKDIRSTRASISLRDVVGSELHNNLPHSARALGARHDGSDATTATLAGESFDDRRNGPLFVSEVDQKNASVRFGTHDRYAKRMRKQPWTQSILDHCIGSPKVWPAERLPCNHLRSPMSGAGKFVHRFDSLIKRVAIFCAPNHTLQNMCSRMCPCLQHVGVVAVRASAPQRCCGF